MKIRPPVVITAVISAFFVVGVWLAPVQTDEPTRRVDLHITTYKKLVLMGDSMRNPDGKSTSIPKVIESLMAGCDFPEVSIGPAVPKLTAREH